MISHARQPPSTRIPAEPGLWLFVFGDLVVFALFFAMYYSYRSQDLQGFSSGQLALSPERGLVYTLLLLTSSLLVAAAVTGRNLRNPRRNVFFLDAAALCGVAFAVLKVLEYVHLAPLAYAGSNFWIMYFSLTGIHLVHVVIGLGVLVYVRGLVAQSPLDEHRTRLLEGGGIFWHLVDALWVILFSMLFLAR